jgi:isochorismate synthase
VDAVLALLPDGDLALWDEGPDTWALAGRGTAVRLTGNGLADVRRQAEAMWPRVQEFRDPRCAEVPSAWLVGGAAFRTGGTREEPWTPFADADFCLPRWSYLVRGSDAAVRLCVTADELPLRERWLEEFANLAWDQGDVPSSATGPVGAVAASPPVAPAWTALVQAALVELDAGRLAKVVAARRTLRLLQCTIDVPGLLLRLRDRHPGVIRFAIGRGNSVFLGATPERLLERRGRQVTTDALAGTVRHGEVHSAKDHREHTPVVAAIAADLQAFCDRVDADSVPGVRRLRDVQHLWTRVQGQLASDAHVLDVGATLHPTPAVCGLPRPQALAFIDAHEEAPRGWYAGPVGWFDASGDGVLAVAIRSALVRGPEAWLHAGAGLVCGSDPEAEWHETTWKLATIGSVLEGA